MLTDEDFNKLTSRLCTFPLPNDYSRQILKCMHRMHGENPVAVEYRPTDIRYNFCMHRMHGENPVAVEYWPTDIRYNFLRNLKEDGKFKCCLFTTLAFQDYYDSHGIRYDAFKMCARSLILVYPNMPSYDYHTNFLIQTWTKTPSLNKNLETYINSVSAKNDICSFAAVLRMVFGAKGFHYICSLSHDKDLHSFCTKRTDADIDAMAARLYSSSFSSTCPDDITCGINNQYLHLFGNHDFQTSLLNSISNKELRDVAELSAKL